MTTRYKVAQTMASHLAYSPATIHMEAFEMLTDAMDDKYDVVDANNPFVQSGEMTATAVCGLMMRMDGAERKRYARLAQTMADLYPHMSDQDVVDIFATPVRNHLITLGLSAKQIRSLATYNDNTGLRHIHIPRDTVFNAEGYHFTIHQPIVITVWDNGDIQALFNADVESPILTRQVNTIAHRSASYEGVEYFVMDIPTDQLNVVSFSESLSGARKWTAEIEVEDSFFYARAYYTTDGSNWTEMHTVFDADIYDPTNPTMVIEVDDNIVKAHIPDIFITENMVGITARVDIYTTVGEASIDLSNVESGEWAATWNDFSNLSTGYVAPLENITSRLIYSTDSTSGGRDAKTFKEVKHAVLYQNYGKRGAYTEDELNEHYTSAGYTFSLRKDTLFNRVYVASRSLDDVLPLKATGLTTGVGVSNEAVTVYTKQADLSYGLVRNEDRCCLLPSLLYKEGDGVMVPLTDTEYNELLALDSSLLVEELNDSNYAFSPFHTVLDYSNAVFRARSYWLTNPQALYRNVSAQNAKLGYTITSSDVALELTEGGYQLTVTADQPSGVEVIYLQLTLRDRNDDLVYYSAEGTVNPDATVTFVFMLPTTFDITSDHEVDIIATDSSAATVTTRCSLSQSVNLIYIVPSASAHASGFDDKGYLGVYSETVTALTHETVTLEFGKYMNGLFLLPATQLKAATYQQYTVNVEKTYEESIYERDALGLVLYYDADGLPYFNQLHAAGDTVYDTDGNVVYLHEVGDYVLNAATGLPIQESDIDYLREIRMPLFDARFYFATNPYIETYREAIPEAVLGYLEGDIADYRPKILEGTQLYFEPLATQQRTEVQISEERTVTMRTALSFTVVFLASPAAYDNYEFREAMEAAAKAALLEAIGDGYFTMKEINTALNALGGDKIYNVTVTDPTGGTGYAKITEGLSSFSLAKTMTLKANGERTIVDDITFTWTK